MSHSLPAPGRSWHDLSWVPLGTGRVLTLPRFLPLLHPMEERERRSSTVRLAKAISPVARPLSDATLPRHRLPRNPAGRPSRLEIESPGDSIDVEQFTRKMQVRTYPAFHRAEI